MKNYTPHHLLLFTGIDVQCQGASTWSLHGQTKKLSPALLEVLMQDQAIDWVKPLLRPLESMTESEAIHITKLALDIKDYQITDMTSFSVLPIKGEIIINAHYYDLLLERYDDEIVTIDESFDIWHNENSLSVFNQPHIFQYLIQCQFDVFNWIPSGTALDKTKIK